MRKAKNIIFIVFGSLLTSIGYDLFLVPHKITPGGVGGIAIVLYNLFKFPFGLCYALLNIPIFILGMKNLGFKFGMKTILSIILIFLFSDFIHYVLKPPILTHDLLLSSLYGALLLGAGIGFVFRGGGSTGGTDILGRIMNKYTGLSTGVSILIVDSIVIAIAGTTFKSFDIVLFSYIALFVSSKLVDMVLEGRDYARQAIITTTKGDKIVEAITKKLNRGSTLMKGIGGYTGRERDVIYTVISIRETGALRNLVHEIDPDAFVVITTAHEVLGKGFRPRA
ncbi:YitT family protein [candidate division WOR-3 bacterium]|nr:YitT family protein [candidate division WOR-3 bacterium]